MILNNKSNSFIQYVGSGIYSNNPFSKDVDNSFSEVSKYFNSAISEHIEKILVRDVTLKSYASSLGYIREQNISAVAYSSFLKSEKFIPRKFDTKSNTIYDDVADFKMAVVEKFKSSIMSEELEFGVIGNTTKDIKKFLAINKDYTVNAITQYALDNFDNANVVYSVLHTLAHVDYSLIAPAGATFAMSATLHPNINIKDFAIQCFDMWESKESLGYLKIIKIETSWLNDYLQEVIKHIERLNG